LADLPSSAGIDAILYGTAEGISYEMGLASLVPDFDWERCDWGATRPETSLEKIHELLAEQGFPTVEPHHRISINSACATGNQAIGIAFQNIQRGEWTRCLVGGVDARCAPSNLMNFQMLGALTTADVPSATSSRPFDRTRSGFVRGEGAATLIVESLESARARGATILAEVAGYANTSDAYRLTDGRDDCASVIRAMERALGTAGIAKEQIDYINAHGTSTALNDRLETKAIKEVFGAHAYRIGVSSLKSQLGHSTVAAGAIEAVACILMLNRQKIAPTINYQQPDPDCDLDYVPNTSREAKLDYVLSNNFGFGGQNACLVFRRWGGQ
jgi:3-oxoacyl-[acyl-carrier-protein] synthase II